MFNQLEEINRIFSDLQPHIELFDVDLETLRKQPDFEERRQLQKEYVALFKSEDAKLISVLRTLTPEQILEGYVEGCRIFQRRVGGFMVQYFDPVYIPIMKAEIINEHYYNCSLFLQELANQLGNDVQDLVLACLSCKNLELKETAIAVCNQLQLIAARSNIKEIASDEDEHPEISNVAKQVLERLS